MSRTYDTRNDLKEAVRHEMASLLNANLATGIHLTLQAKQAHWNVKGPNFFQLHELFDKVYDEAVEWMDTMAERAVQLGGTAEASLETVHERSGLSASGLEAADGRGFVDALSGSLAAFGAAIRDAIDKADAAGDADTADLFTEVSRGADKMLWFLEAHLQAER